MQESMSKSKGRNVLLTIDKARLGTICLLAAFTIFGFGTTYYLLQRFW